MENHRQTYSTLSFFVLIKYTGIMDNLSMLCLFLSADFVFVLIEFARMISVCPFVLCFFFFN